MIYINTEDRNIILFLIAYSSLVVFLYIAIYEVRVFTNCFFESFNVVYFNMDYELCDIKEYERIFAGGAN